MSIEMKENGSSRKQGAPSPCAACKLLRRRCAQDCVFAPYFPADEPHKFANVHKVFGASNVSKMLQDLPVQQRGDAVSSMVYEANARVRDPVYGCVGAISSLQHQIDALQAQLAVAQAEVVHLRVRQAATLSTGRTHNHDHHRRHHHHHHHQHHDGGFTPTYGGSPSSTHDNNRVINNNNKLAAAQSKSLFEMDMAVEQTHLGSEHVW